MASRESCITAVQKWLRSGPGDLCGPSLSLKDFCSCFLPAETDIIIQHAGPRGALSLKQPPITVMLQVPAFCWCFYCLVPYYCKKLHTCHSLTHTQVLQLFYSPISIIICTERADRMKAHLTSVSLQSLSKAVNTLRGLVRTRG